MDLLFNGGATWGIFEYIGAIQYIKDNNVSIGKLYGVSAGSAIAMCYLLDVDTDEFIQFMTNLVRENMFQPITVLEKAGIKYLFEKRPDAYKIVNDRLFIGLTNANGFYFKSNFTSNDDLENALICCGTLPILSKYDSICDKKLTIDGAISFTKSCIPKGTIVINPTVAFPFSVLPPPDILQHLLIKLGYLRFIHFMNIKNNDIEDAWHTRPEFLPLWLYLAKF